MLKVSHLEGVRAEKVLFSGLTFSVEPGNWVWVRGVNGSGKTTLLKTLVGLVPTSGKVLWKGKPVSRFEHSYLQELLYLAHIPALHPALTPEENLSWYAAIHFAPYVNKSRFSVQDDACGPKGNVSGPRSDVCGPEVDVCGPEGGHEGQHLLRQLGLSSHLSVPCEQLSFGQCQRVALARLSFHLGKLWILDEPCTGIDEAGQYIFEKWLAAHLNQGGIAVIASHLPFKNVPKPQRIIELGTEIKV